MQHLIPFEFGLFPVLSDLSESRKIDRYSTVILLLPFFVAVALQICHEFWIFGLMNTKTMMLMTNV